MILNGALVTMNGHVIVVVVAIAVVVVTAVVILGAVTF
jgi:hypothetical protein